jgi:formate transporter
VSNGGYGRRWSWQRCEPAILGPTKVRQPAHGLPEPHSVSTGFTKAGRLPSRFAAFLHSDLTFMVGALLGPLGAAVAMELHLDPARKGPPALVLLALKFPALELPPPALAETFDGVPVPPPPSIAQPPFEQGVHDMDSLKPAAIVTAMIEAGIAKAALGPFDLLVRGALSGALLGFATSLAIGATTQTGQPIVGALIFPVGFVMIVLLGLELVTGSFALVPLALLRGRTSLGTTLSNWGWVFLGNLIGSVFYAGLLAIALTMAGQVEPAGVAASIVKIAEAKTIGYAHFGMAGMLTVFVKAMLCNWMVCLGVVMALSSTSTIGRIAGAWMPILVFFAQGFEHSVVNMFVIPAGMMMGAKVSLGDWWIWNQIPVTLGNLVGGLLFTGLALYVTYGRTDAAAPVALPANAD